jgi:hypothetical protein
MTRGDRIGARAPGAIRAFRRIQERVVICADCFGQFSQFRDGCRVRHLFNTGTRSLQCLNVFALRDGRLVFDNGDGVAVRVSTSLT